MSVESRLFDENPNNGHSIRVKHLEYIAEFYEALFPSYLKASYRQCQLCVRWQLGSNCDEVLKTTCTWSGS